MATNIECVGLSLLIRKMEKKGLRLWQRFNELMCEKHSEQCLVSGTLFIAAGWLCASRADLFESDGVQRTVLRQWYREIGQTSVS